MTINFGPKTVQMDDVRIVFRNFSGVGTKFNREGDRNFCVVIDDRDIADALIEQGWNVKIKPPREEGDEPFMYLKVNVKYNDRGPAVYLDTNGRQNRLTEDTVDILDNIDIARVDLDLRPYDWDFNGKSGRTAYLDRIWVVQHVDRFAARYAQNDSDVPFVM